MKSLWKSLVSSTLIVVASAGVAQTLVAQENDDAGIVRISRARTVSYEPSQLMPVSAVQSDATCVPSTTGSMGSGACDPGMSRMVSEMDGTYDVYGRRRRRYHRNSQYSNYQTDGYGNGNGNGAYGDGLGQGGMGQGGLGHGGLGHGGLGHGYYSNGCPNPNSQAFCNYLRCKFGYFIPTGGGGQGLPWAGHYSRVYPLNPYYSDSRDGQAWAAQGYGVPISVPLAPVVAYTYEYGWGLPSSRIVPVSRPAY